MSESINPEEIDTYQFWGIVLKEGIVRPPNIDHDIYYPANVVQETSDKILDADIRVDHIDMACDPSEIALGGVEDYKLHDDKLFIKNYITRSNWENFVQTVSERQNVIIQTTFNDIVREVDAGNLALSAGLSVATVPTALHDHTVAYIDQYSEVSIVSKPASPASYAWGCDDRCDVVFGE